MYQNLYWKVLQYITISVPLKENPTENPDKTKTLD